MRAGKLLLINVGAASPNLLVNTTDNWPASDVWNYEKWAQDDIYKTIVKDDENFDT